MLFTIKKKKVQISPKIEYGDFFNNLIIFIKLIFKNLYVHKLCWYKQV